MMPTEAEEQEWLFEWLRLKGIPSYHVPNESLRSDAYRAILYRRGLEPGIADICIPRANKRHHGLYIELKRVKGGRLSPAQAEWGRILIAEGYYWAVCKGWLAASVLVEQYLSNSVDLPML
jgi:hypothetical protein